jgi:alpha-amylase
MKIPHVASDLFRRTAPAVAALLLGLASLHAAAPAATPPPSDAPSAGWWRDALFYEVFVRSFADASSGPLAHDGIGDLQGLIEHLDYLNDGRGAAGNSLGVNAVWLMPMQPSPSYHGYDVTDYFAVNPQYGDVALMKTFVAEAHRRGIRVIVDFVLNHASSRHPLFVAATSGDPAKAVEARKYFRFASIPENLYGPWGERVWHPINGEFYYGVFGANMPDWNFREPAVTEHHFKAAAFWLREIGVDGLRLDAVRFFFETGRQLQDTEETRRWLRDFTAYCHSVKPGSFIVGEDWTDMEEVARSIRGRSLDSAFEFDLEKATLESVRLETPALLTQTLDQLGGLYGIDSPWATIITNHDQERALTELRGDTVKLRLATELLMTLPGVPFVYYGEELGMAGAKPDPELRTPMPWTAESPNAGFCAPDVKPWHAPKPEFNRVNVATESADPESMLALYRELIRLRADSPALRHGVALPVSSSDSHVFVQMRATEHDAVLVLGNFGKTAQPGPVLSLSASPLRKSWGGATVFGSARPMAAAFDDRGGFTNWRPFAELPPSSVTVIRWQSQ